MAKKANRIVVALKCMECGNVNYTSYVNKKNQEGTKLEVNKFCENCKAHKMHKETKVK